MAVVRQAGALLLAALFMSRGLFAQDSLPAAPAAPGPPDVPAVLPTAPAAQAHVTLRPTELRYLQQETLLVPQPPSLMALYVHAWPRRSPELRRPALRADRP